MNRNQLMFAWAAVIIDMFFVVVNGFNFGHSIEKHSWTGIIDLLLLLLWARWFIRDTEKLRR